MRLFFLFCLASSAVAAPIADTAKQWIGETVYFMPQDPSRGKVFDDVHGRKSRAVEGNSPAKVLAVGRGNGLLFHLRFADGRKGWARAVDLLCAGIWCEDDHPQRRFPDRNPLARPGGAPARAQGPAFRPGDYLDGDKHLALKPAGRKGFRFQFTVESPNGRQCSLAGTLGRGAAEYVRGTCRVRFERRDEGREQRLEVTSSYGCGDSCTHGDWYSGHYYAARSECVPKTIAAAHEAFVKMRTPAKARDGLPAVLSFLERCHDFLTYSAAAVLKNDAALFELALGRPKDCVARLEPITKEDWFQTKEPDSRPARENIARAKVTQANLDTCRAAQH